MCDLEVAKAEKNLMLRCVLKQSHQPRFVLLWGRIQWESLQEQ